MCHEDHPKNPLFNKFTPTELCTPPPPPNIQLFAHPFWRTLENAQISHVIQGTFKNLCVSQLVSMKE